jgi:prepilin-type N-terminal cleavage/methylation domain-containing protein
MRKEKGFSLIELLIVVAIILIIAAIAIPGLMRARIAANESSAAASVRIINSAEISYAAAYPNLGFATTLTYLGGASGASCTPSTSSGCFIDSALASGTKSGYTYALQIGSSSVIGSWAPSYSIGATPQLLDITGIRSFCSFEDAVVRSTSAALTPPCTASLPAIQ